MAREGVEDKNELKTQEGGKTREGGKTVRFVSNDTSDKCDNAPRTRISQSPVDLVQSLVPQLPGLDKDTIYVISGPFPNYDPAHGHSQLLMATPISPGVTVVAVPVGPPPPPHPVPVNQTLPHRMPAQPCNNLRRDVKLPQPTYSPQPISSPHPPQMLHWDTHHPVGQTIPLRQPNPPVYYNVPSNTSSGLQSPASDGSSMSENSSIFESSSLSESSSMSGDQDEANLVKQCQRMNLNHLQPPVWGYPPKQEQYPIYPQYCHMSQPVPVYGQQGCGGQACVQVPRS